MGCVIPTPVYGRPREYVLVDYAAAPAWLATNRYILSGYRAYFSFRLCLVSIFRLHNESANMWSHLAATGLAAALLHALVVRSWVFDPVARAVGADGPGADVVAGHSSAFAIYLAAGVVAFAASAIFHTFYCTSAPVSALLARLDYMGIALLMSAAFMPGIHFGFACYPLLSSFYQLLITLVSAATLGLLLFPSIGLFHQGYYTRLGMYGMLAGLAVVPISHWVYLHGWAAEEVSLILGRMLMVFFWLGVAAVIYVTQIPERWFPGTFDYFGHSHMIWHAIAAWIFWYHLNSALLYLDFRSQHACPKGHNPIEFVANAADR
ncbi:progestin and adipoQ receptor family member 3 [Thecamonas trahens ATCC 50062]|uniref:Progestin and adipoQ receptor family member 3 n=1 Tax=Thecamonas trahens ATCC 50062 TaxID=461836 RepID=A0A0L0DBK6_THETB|nr:progestin and adipoQ receptor family member 3 [Thecamonas trahens ATCC 50062]KNC49610.1 progestin and adipoQ receptor family member 3 [Thecamonas trahens ATCC 50062]|eukprot:XP_013757717.1 progestin and adipoQ receptor family member 3 [Thecamonas trahens ATCC 50062]